MSGKSSGSKVGTAAGLILVFAFFLPWVKACGEPVSGYRLTTSDGLLESPGLLWLIVVAGLFCVALPFVARSDTRPARIRIGLARLAATVVALWSVYQPYELMRRAGGSAENLLAGGWLLILGYLGLLASSAMDIFASGRPADEAVRQSFSLQAQGQPQPAAAIPPPPAASPPAPATIAPAASPPASWAAPVSPRFCFKCGAEQTAGSRFCMHCGQDLTAR